jgi:protein-arginine kinase activator protein McsA
MDTGLGEVERCKGWCKEPAEVTFHYLISKGPQVVPLCANCARRWSKTYGSTAAGHSLSITAIDGTN